MLDSSKLTSPHIVQDPDSMGWRGILCSSFFFLSMVEASSRLGEMRSLNLGAESAAAFSWPILSASIFEQKFLIGLILMVPVYALESFLSLLDSNAAFNCEAIRDCYEAFALYCFERYLIACLGGEKRTIEFMESQSVLDSSTPLLKDAYAYGVVEHPFPLNCLIGDWPLGPTFYHAVKVGIVQYMILKLICALLAMILETFGVYGEGKFDWRYGYPYLAVVLNFSQTWALYCLVQFYSVIKDKLQPIKPLAKFLTFKSIVFLTWWQGIAVAFLFSMGAFKGSLAQELKTRIQDYIICIEMGVAAVVTFMSFQQYLTNEEKDVCIVDDMKYTVSHVVEPVERGFAKINKTLHQISENVKRHEEQRKSIKDDIRDNLVEGSISDSGLSSGRRQQSQSKASTSQNRAWR
ncbi:Protein of unknown function D [Prunus dulcis]|uniref:Organic solute transporter ostalpha protein n=1 Tax=Prunus dulcis TaxID=3755 RepID=A0A4Y1RYD0_PRUDU|nr:Protein of unknown function D [Prunus dulcis]